MATNTQNQHVSTFIKGMDTDTSDMVLGADKYRYAENIRIVTNQDSNTGEVRLIEGCAKELTLQTILNEVYDQQGLVIEDQAKVRLNKIDNDILKNQEKEISLQTKYDQIQQNKQELIDIIAELEESEEDTSAYVEQLDKQNKKLQEYNNLLEINQQEFAELRQLQIDYSIQNFIRKRRIRRRQAQVNTTHWHIKKSTSILNYGVVICEFLSDEEDEQNGCWFVVRYDNTKENDKNIKLAFGICDEQLGDNLSLVTNYEDENNIKLYIADGEHQIMSINLMQDVPYTEISQISQLGDVELLNAPHDFMKIDGSLPYGLVGYTYVLYNYFGKISSMSAMSEIQIVNAQESGIGYEGGLRDEVSNVGFSFVVDLSNKYNHIRVFRITQKSLSESITQEIIVDSKYLDSSSSMTVFDYGQTISDSEQLPDIYYDQYIPKIIEQKNNRLFKANLKSNQIVSFMNFDARSYSSGDRLQGYDSEDNHILNENGEIQIEDIPATGEIKNDNFNLSLPYDIDCWKSFRVNITEDKEVLVNGVGPNIYWKYVESQQIINEDASGSFLVKPHTDEIHTSLHRDEIYRYGIVLTDQNGNQSEAKWIADIRTPDAYLYNQIQYGTFNNKLRCINLNIQFFVKNLPEQCKKFEIVRCKLTNNDKATICQGALASTIDMNEGAVIPTGFVTTTRMMTGDDAYYNSTTSEGRCVYRIVDSYLVFPDAERRKLIKTCIPNKQIFQLFAPEISYFSSSVQDALSNSNIYIRPVCCLTSDKLYGMNSEPYHKRPEGSKTIEYSNFGTNLDSQWYNVYTINHSLNPTNHGIAVKYLDKTYITLSEPNPSYSQYALHPRKDEPLIKDDETPIYISSLYNALNYPDKIDIDEQPNFRFYPVSGEQEKISHGDKYNYVPLYHLTKTLTNGIGSHKSYRQQDNKNVRVKNYRMIEHDAEDKIIFQEDGYPTFLNKNFVIGNKVFYPNTAWGTKPEDYPIDSDDYNVWYAERLPQGLDAREYFVPGLFANTGKSLCIELEKDDDSNDDIIDYVYSGYGYPFGAVICNLRKYAIPYGGNSYISRVNSVYYSYGAVVNNINKNYNEITPNDGDCFIQCFEFFSAHKCHSKSAKRSMIHTFSSIYSIPLQTTIDLYNTCGDSWSSVMLKDGNTEQEASFIQDEPGVFFLEYFTQRRPQFVYNTAYSSQLSVYSYSGIRDEDLKTSVFLPNRVVYSELKSANESVDNYLIFKAANFLDVDPKYGEITDLKTFKNELVFWQEFATGVLSTNEKQLIENPDGNNLLLGTGDVLQRYDYITTIYGMRDGDMSKTESGTDLYWWDGTKNEMLSYRYSKSLIPSKGVVELGAQKSVKNYLNSSVISENPLLTYDYNNHEVLFQIGNDKTIVYNELLDVFTSLYNIKPINNVCFEDQIQLLDDKTIYRWNTHKNNKSYGFDDSMLFPQIQAVVNTASTQTKVFDTIEFGGRFYGGGEAQNRKTPVYLQIQKNRDLGGLTNLKFEFSTPTKQKGYINNKNIGTHLTNVEYDFKMSLPRSGEDPNNGIGSNDKALHYGDRFKGKFMNYTLSSVSNDLDFSLQYIITKFRASWN